MKKNKITNGLISTILFISLSTNVLSATLTAGKNRSDAAQIKILKMNINWKIENIKKTIQSLKKLRFITAAIVAGAGAVPFIISTAIALGLFVIAFSINPETQKQLIIRGFTKQSIAIWLLPLFLGISVGSFSLGTGVVTAASAISSFVGISVFSLKNTFDGVKELEQIEKTHPGVLTKNHKLLIAQFKNLAKGPAMQGIFKGLRIKAARESIANSILEKNPTFTSKFKTKKSVRIIVSQYLNLRRKASNLQEFLNKTNKQTVTQINRKWKHIYKNTQKKLNKIQNNIITLEAKHPFLKTLEHAVQTYKKTIQNILEEFTKPVLKPEKEKPIIVPL